MFLVSKNQAKAKASTLHKFLIEKGCNLPSSELLNAVSRMAGYDDWNALSAQFNEQAVDALLLDHERQHAYDSLKDGFRADETNTHGFGPETVIQAASGFWLAVSSIDAADYIRICDPLGREIVYWSAGEFADDPTCVLGALARYLNRGRMDLMPNPLKPSVDKLEVADIASKGRKRKTRKGLSEIDWAQVVRVSLRDAHETEAAAVDYCYHDNYEEILVALDAERLGTADEEDIAFLDDEADAVAIDWGDEIEGEGLDTSELRGIKHGPGNTWILKDGRIMQFYRLESV